MRTDDNGRAVPGPTPLMDDWREACLYALATADPHGAHDRYLAYFIGEYFLAIHCGLVIIAAPGIQERLCSDEAARFLAMLAAGPERRHLAEAKADQLRRAGLTVFPNPIDRGGAQ